MKITLGVEETSYGSITVDVAKDATKEDIEIAAIEGIHDGMACWNKSYEKVTEVLDCEDSTVPCVSFDKFMESTPKDTQNAPSKLEKMTKKEKEEAIQGLKNLAKQFRGYEPNEKMFDLAIKALESQPCDAVSRSDVLRKVRRFAVDESESVLDYLHGADYWRKSLNERLVCIEEEVKNLPPVLSQPLKGKWIHWTNDFKDYATCSCCDYGEEGEVLLEDKTPFCPMCGADMRGEKDDE